MNIDIEWWAKNFGWPGVIFFCALFGGWRVWEFLKTFLADIFTEQIHLTKAATSAIKTLPTADQVDGIDKKIDAVLIQRKTDGNLLVEIHEAVVPQDKRKTA